MTKLGVLWVMGVQVADVRKQVLLSLHTDFVNYSKFAPADEHEANVGTVLDQVVRWAGARKTLRDH